MRVLEGPYAPQQGNFAVAGSADYQLGLDRRGLTAEYTIGSFDTQRLLAPLGPERRADRHVRRRRVLHDRRLRHEPPGQARHGDRPVRDPRRQRRASLRLNATAYATEYNSAGRRPRGRLRVRAASASTAPRTRTRSGNTATPRVALGDVREPLQGHRRLAAALRHRPDDAPARELDGLPRATSSSRRRRRTASAATSSTSTSTSSPFGGRGFARWHGEALRAAAGVRGRLLRARRPDDLDAVPRHGGATRTRTSPTPTHVHARRRRRLRRRQRAPPAVARRFAAACAPTCSSSTCSTTAPSSEQGVDSPSNAVPRGRPAVPERARARRLPRAVPALDDRERRRHAARHARRSGRSITSSSRRARATASARSTRATSRRGCSRRSSASSREDLGVSYDNELGARRASRRSRSSSTPTRTRISSSTRPQGRSTLVERLDAHGLVRLGAGARDLLRRRRQRDAREGDVRRHAPASSRTCPTSSCAATRRSSTTCRGSSITSRSAATLGYGVSYVGQRPLPYGELSDVIFVSDASVEPRAGASGTCASPAQNLFDSKYKLGEYNYASDFHSQRRAHARARALVHRGRAAHVMLSVSATLGGAS